MQVVGINFLRGGKVYYYLPNGLEFHMNDKVIVETPKGLEMATVVLPSKDVEGMDITSKVIRIATDKDKAKVASYYERQDEVLRTVQKAVDKYQLDLKLVSADFPFDGSRIVVSFVSDDRVDFRDLVKDLAQTLKTRIELKQIGVRDQVKEIGSIGVCGKECCCKQYLSDFDKVSIKMAKNQGLSLTPSKISGMCGRLMCCLSFEDNYYQEVAKKMPKMGSTVTTPAGEGTVYYNDMLKEMVTVKMMVNDMPKLTVFPLSEIGQGYKKQNHEEEQPLQESSEVTSDKQDEVRQSENAQVGGHKKHFKNKKKQKRK